MKGFFVLFLIFLSAFNFAMVNVEAQVETKLYMDPPAVTASLGGTFTVNVKVAEVKNLYTYQFYLKWEPSLLELISVTEGSFLNAEKTYKTSFNARIYNTPDPFNVSGYVYVACTLLGEPASAAQSGDGTLATLEFLVKGEGESSLHLYDTKLLDPMLKEMSHVTNDGDFHSTNIEISVKPSTIANTSLLPEYTFSVNISVTQVVDLYTWSLNMSWDPFLLSVTDVNEGSFLNQGSYNTTFTTYIDQEHGSLYANCSLFDEPPELSASGDGTLLSITFRVESIGATVLHLYDTKLLSYGGIEVFHVVRDGYFRNLLRDISIISVEVSPTTVKAGDYVSITVTVKNKGDETENFDVTVYWNDSNFGTLSTSDLNPGAEETLTFRWSTEGVDEGNYTIKAVASTVLWETDIDDNNYIDGYVVIMPPEQAFPFMPILVVSVIVIVSVVVTGIIFLRKKR